MGERACCVLTTGRHPLNRKFNKPHHQHINNNTRSLTIALEAKITAAPTMQVTILACLAAVLVLAPAVRAQECCEDFAPPRVDYHTYGADCVAEHTTLEECQCGCAEDPNCSAVDWNVASDPWLGCRCWHHSFGYFLEQVYNPGRVVQHQVVARGFGENQCPDGGEDDSGDGGEDPPPVTVYEELKTYDEAKEACESQGECLLTLKTVEIYEANEEFLLQLGSIVGDSGEAGWVWIGGSGDGENFPWQWSPENDDITLPDNWWHPTTHGNCLRTKPDYYKVLSKGNCDWKTPYACQSCDIAALPAEPGSDDGDDSASGDASGGGAGPSVTVYEDLKTKEEAYTECESRGLRLLTLETVAKYEANRALLGTLSEISSDNGDAGWVWIAGYGEGESFPWHWEDGSDITLPDDWWHPTTHGDCLRTKPDYHKPLSKGNCDWKSPYACEAYEAVPIDPCDIGNGGCGQICQKNGDSAVCACEDGFKLGSDGKSCSKVHPCDMPGKGGCGQI